ncbi:MAG: hypothetical protein ACLQMH_07495 [Solirubrobacteraceae bacterium]
MSLPIVVLPDEFAELIVRCGKLSGILELHADKAEDVFLVGGFTRGRHEGGRHGGSQWAAAHYLGAAPREPLGVWFRADPVLHFVGTEGFRRSGALPLEDFKAGVEGMWIGLHRHGYALALTYANHEDGTRDWLAWLVSQAEQRAEVIGIAHVHEEMGSPRVIVGELTRTSARVGV